VAKRIFDAGILLPFEHEMQSQLPFATLLDAYSESLGQLVHSRLLYFFSMLLVRFKLLIKTILYLLVVDDFFVLLDLSTYKLIETDIVSSRF